MSAMDHSPRTHKPGRRQLALDLDERGGFEAVGWRAHEEHLEPRIGELLVDKEPYLCAQDGVREEVVASGEEL